MKVDELPGAAQQVDEQQREGNPDQRLISSRQVTFCKPDDAHQFTNKPGSQQPGPADDQNTDENEQHPATVGFEEGDKGTNGIEHKG